MKKIIVCIVIFNKRLEESKSFDTLQKIEKGLVDEIIIYNNGPSPISINKERVTVNNILVNASLSKIYNHFIINNEADIFLILDDDSSLNFEFISELKESNNIISSPQITCNGKKFYPIFTKHETQTISSGMAISNEYKKKCLHKNVKIFDERFDLYGVDTYFCKKLKAESIPLTILNSTIEHDLSHITSQNNKFREREVLLANSAAFIPYFTLENSLRVIKGLIKSIFHREFHLSTSIILSILSKRVIRPNND